MKKPFIFKRGSNIRMQKGKEICNGKKTSRVGHENVQNEIRRDGGRR